MKAIGKITYSWYNAILGVEKQTTQNVVSVKEWNENDIDYTLQSGQCVCLSIGKAELFGKSGNYLKLVEFKNFVQDTNN